MCAALVQEDGSMAGLIALLVLCQLLLLIGPHEPWPNCMPGVPGRHRSARLYHHCGQNLALWKSLPA